MTTLLDTALNALQRAGEKVQERSYGSGMALVTYAAACTFLSIAIDFKKLVASRSKEISTK